MIVSILLKKITYPQTGLSCTYNDCVQHRYKTLLTRGIIRRQMAACKSPQPQLGAPGIRSGRRFVPLGLLSLWSVLGDQSVCHGSYSADESKPCCCRLPFQIHVCLWKESIGQGTFRL